MFLSELSYALRRVFDLRSLWATVFCVGVAALSSSAQAQASADEAKKPAAPAGAEAKKDAVPEFKGSTLQRIRDTGVIVLGHRNDALPFAYLDGNKRPIGYGVDVCHEVIKVLKNDLKMPNLRVEYVSVTAANRMQIVNTGKADLECGLTVNDRERRKKVGYAMPYYFAGPRILTRADAGVTNFHDLTGKRIVSAKGANAIPILKKRIEEGRLKNTVLIEAANNAESWAMLEKGEVDAWVTTDNLLYAYRANAKKPSDYIVTGDFLVLEAVAIMLRKHDVEFKKAVDRALAGLMLDGVIARLYNKWFLAPIPPNNAVMGIPMSPLLRDQLRWPSDRTGDDVLAEDN
jgi:glutamate/aspartate transport system substrate-binding protein